MSAATYVPEVATVRLETALVARLLRTTAEAAGMAGALAESCELVGGRLAARLAELRDQLEDVSMATIRQAHASADDEDQDVPLHPCLECGGRVADCQPWARCCTVCRLTDGHPHEVAR